MDSNLVDLINKGCGQLSTSSIKRCPTFAEFQANSMFTARHYVAIAEAIKKAGHPDLIVDHLVEMFVSDNPKFDISRFLKAAGLSAMK